MNASPSASPPHCPKCEYDLAALDGAPATSDGVFTDRVACPECGLVVPSGGRVIEGSLHPVNLGANPTIVKVFFAVNAVAFLAVISSVIGGFSPMPRIASLAMAVSSGGCAFFLGWDLWRRSRRARGAARAAPAGREIRWVFSPAGLESIDRRRLLKPPTISSIPASRIHRVTGSPAQVTIRGADGTPEVRDAALLTAWAWKLDAGGRAIDLVPSSIYTLDGLRPLDSSEGQASMLASRLEQDVGISKDRGPRDLPRAPLSDPRARGRFFKVVLVAGYVLPGVALPIMIARSKDGLGLGFPAMMLIGLASAVALPLIVYFGTLGVIASSRRRWARRHGRSASASG